MERHPKLLDRQRTALLVVDVQEKLWRVMRQRQAVADRIVMMIKACRFLSISIFITEQYPKGLGRTLKAIQEALSQPDPLIKMTFSCCGATELPQNFRQEGIEQVVLVGIESHVCVMQTAMDLLARGFQVHVLRDAISTRYELDEETAIERMAAEGVVISTAEAALFELMQTAEAAEFKKVSGLIK
jgi:nicotinamidase-related amidase